MRIPRVYVDLPLEPGATLELPAAQARHLTQVLRLPPDAPLVLFNGDGCDYPSHLTRAERNGTAARVGTPGAIEPVPPLEIHLALGVSKGERMDYALQKSVELGVGRITPLFTERSQVHLSGQRLERRLEHWRGILIGACEQSGRRRLPHLATAATYSHWLIEHAGGGLLLDPEAARSLAAIPAPGATVTLLIGPEGGLSPRERASARDRGFEGVRLGPRILRTETAPLAAIAVIQALWGDLVD
ncbi:16S rRNA (uracil(1498)-N(3))-methyltransferase [Thiocapsa sp.]|uniref:16S rRNA (uracil(1498)-N(3))-methyltransferase n=1 Tax=Thiocapsa sp. TaxID=2024551 RepID=UPI0025E703E5|nr:16S rRNA (uracil(1498)-N(3))-methyltransferase [Thiocapsa sp.]